MLCSTIIPTIGRRSVTRAVESVLAQNLPGNEFEVIVVNDSGQLLPAANWHTAAQVRIIHTNRRERSVARNTGAAFAAGRYVHFLDDDDYLVPDAYGHLEELGQSSSAKWLYGMTQLTDRQGRPSIRLRHNLDGNCFAQTMAGEWIPLQSSWIDRNVFAQIGGFNPLLAGPEDIDLLRRVALHHDVAQTPNLVATVIMGGEGSSTNYARHPSSSRRARESILNEPEAYRRMVQSAATPAWRGRVARVYLTSAVWNIQRKRVFTAASRLWLTLAAILQSGTGLVAAEFWQAVKTPYASITFENGKRAAQRQKQHET